MNFTENSKQIFPEMKLRGLVPNFYIHVSVHDLYIPMIGPQTQYNKIGRDGWDLAESGWDLAESGWDLAESGWDLAEKLERLTANAKVATVLGSIAASSDTVESEGRQMKQCWIKYITNESKKSTC